VGLHSYGFTNGVFQILMAFYVFEGIVVALAGLWWLSQRYSITVKPGGDAPAPAAPAP
jgi:hypothetical protein